MSSKETKKPGENSGAIWNRQRESDVYEGYGQKNVSWENILGWHRPVELWSLIFARVGAPLLFHLFLITIPLSSGPKLSNSNSIPSHPKSKSFWKAQKSEYQAEIARPMAFIHEHVVSSCMGAKTTHKHTQ